MPGLWSRQLFVLYVGPEWRSGGADMSGFSDRTRRLRVTAVTLLVIAGCVNYLDRSALSVGNLEIRGSLGLSYSQMGLLLSAFAWSYGLAQIPAGILVDRFGPRRALGVGLVLWSFAQIAASFVVSAGQFVVARVALGLGESPMYIGGTRVCADWFRARDRALPISIFNSSSSLAPALAPPLLTVLMLAFGWRAMFLIAGVAGFAVAIAWVALYRNPGDAGIAPAEIALIHADDEQTIEHVGIAQVFWLLRFKTTWGMFLGFVGVIYIFWLYATWLPGYLEGQRHLSIGSAGILSAVPLAAGFVGSVTGGVISDQLGKRGIDPGAACRIPIIWGMIGAAVFTVAGDCRDVVRLVLCQRGFELRLGAGGGSGAIECGGHIGGGAECRRLDRRNAGAVDYGNGGATHGIFLAGICAGGSDRTRERGGLLGDDEGKNRGREVFFLKKGSKNF